MKQIPLPVVCAVVLIAGAIGSFCLAATDTATGNPAKVIAQSSDSTAAQESPAVGEGTVAPAYALCTLTVATVPEGVTVTLDGTRFGQTPLVISNIDTGSHVLLLQKVGYYQKRVAFSLPAAGASSLNFELSAPGRLEISTVPPGAAVAINGADRGATPYSDSLLKPGTYRVRLSKEQCVPVEKTIEISSGATVTIIDTLLTALPESRDSSDSTAVVAEPRKKKGKFFTVGMVAGVFSVFLLILAIFETRE